MSPQTLETQENIESLRQIQYEVSDNLALLLIQLQSSLIITTYQAGKLVGVGVQDARLKLSFHNFDRAMGVAIGKNQVAVGGKEWIYFLKNAPDLATKIDKDCAYDACFLIQGAKYTSDISVHEIAWGKDELLLTNTRFSCLSQLHNNYSFVPTWQPPFIEAIAPEDRCHLNGVAMKNGAAEYVTVLAQSNTSGGWRTHKESSGCILEVPSGQVIATGFAMPHSPRLAHGCLLVLNSGLGELTAVSLTTGQVEPLISLQGYPRGMAIAGRFAFIGLSKIRETSTFGNLPISKKFDDLKCGVAIIDLVNKQQIGMLEFQSGVDEIFDIQLLQGFKNPYFYGPHATAEGSAPIWLVPNPAESKSN